MNEKPMSFPDRSREYRPVVFRVPPTKEQIDAAPRNARPADSRVVVLSRRIPWTRSGS